MIDLYDIQRALTPFRICVLVACILIFTFGMVVLYGKKSSLAIRRMLNRNKLHLSNIRNYRS